MPDLHSRDGTPDDSIEAGPSGQSAAAASRKRGRKQDDSLPPSRSRDIQRAFRARRAALLSNLELRVAFLERENSALRDQLGLAPDGPPLSGPEPEYQRVDGIAEGIEGTSSERPGVAVIAGSPVPSGNGSGTTTKRPRKRQSSGKPAIERDDAADEATSNGPPAPNSLYGNAPSPLATLAHAAGTAEWHDPHHPQAGSPAPHPNGPGGAPPPYMHYPYAASPNGHPMYQSSPNESGPPHPGHLYSGQPPYPPQHTQPNQQHPVPNGSVASGPRPHGWSTSAQDPNAQDQQGAPYTQQYSHPHPPAPAAYSLPHSHPQQHSQYGYPLANQYPQHAQAYGVTTQACCAQPHGASPAGSVPPPPAPMHGQYGYPPPPPSHAPPPSQHGQYAASSSHGHQPQPPYGSGFSSEASPSHTHSGHVTLPPTPVSHTPSPASAATSPAATGSAAAANGRSALGPSAMHTSSHGQPQLPPHQAQQQQQLSLGPSGSSQLYLQQPGHAGSGSTAFTASPAGSAASPLSTTTTVATPQTPLSSTGNVPGSTTATATPNLVAPREYLLRACGLSPRTVSRALAAGVGDADDEHRFAAFCAAVVEIAQRQPGPMKRIKLPRTDSSSSAGSQRQADGATGPADTAGGDKNSLEWNDELCCGGLIDCSAPIFDNTPSYPTPNGSSSVSTTSGRPDDASSPAALPTLPPFLPLRDAFSRLSHALRKAPIELALALSSLGGSAAAATADRTRPDSSFAVVSVPGNREDGIKGTEELWVAEKAVEAAIEADLAAKSDSNSSNRPAQAETCQPKSGCC